MELISHRFSLMLFSMPENVIFFFFNILLTTVWSLAEAPRVCTKFGAPKDRLGAHYSDDSSYDLSYARDLHKTCMC